ncbi:Serine/threonine-protein kinase pkn1 [Aquisphaera giovannonii]|uniref:Serine/threonine-protein kinase pkn1 n=1 Tax=Aquisphaera giovannonii TaxID=406548 RepID=A0A5B9WDW7_9BACT|nr:SUMF1/EgtB/PvdO family nonheme iron enzyme [Aquisphaera giovannonii]QEH38265.1 Serine/threonine-protein kinase pkn1 [Aquisphaera giovannonii]
MRSESSVIDRLEGHPGGAARRPPGGPASPRPPRPGLGSRLLGWLSPRAGRAASRAEAEGAAPRGTEGTRGMAGRLIAEDRYAFVLLAEAVGRVAEQDAAAAWKALGSQMAMVPAGSVPAVLCDGGVAELELGGFFMDRHAVTNRQYQRFVQARGYDDLEIWPREVWPSVARLVDRAGRPGPRDWEGGRFPAGRADHPVAGICWYEAVAYARWVGKRLPTAAEWQKACGWPEHLGGGTCNRYPWGNAFDPSRANLAPSGQGRTAPVGDFPSGATPNGIYQMTGNVWEWLDDPLEAIPCGPGEAFRPWKPMRRILGGAFDTYLPGEAACQFVTGQGELDRRDNIGFRCVLPLDQLRPLP